MTADMIVLLGFSAALFLGAFWGAKAGSKGVLITGVVLGSAVLPGLVIAYFNQKAGALFVMLVGGFSVVGFVQSVLKTKWLAPAGMLLLLSILFFGYTVVKFLNF